MAHCLVTGMTGSGKTTWARKKALSLQRQNRHVIILDPFKRKSWDNGNEHAYITDNEKDFLNAIWSNRECAIFIDEAGETVGKYNDLINSVASKSRNFGHKCFFIMQRPKQISVTIRCQCSELVIFRSSLSDTKDIADEFVEPRINEAHNLKLGEFIYVRKGHKPAIFYVHDL